MDLSVVWLLSCAVAFIVTVILQEIYMWLRNLIPKSVQCWFCLHKTEVPYNLSNSWHCPKCEQYNGFTYDGGYNKTMDQQYDAKLNFSVSILGRSKNAWRSEHSLCNKCNRSQELKVEQLAKFVPLNERNYDAEVEHFRAQIEKAYTLCAKCETLVHTILKREREEYCVPRRLNSTFIPKKPRGTWILLLNILVAMAMSLIGFLQTGGASVLKKELKGFAMPLLKKHVPAAYSAVIKISPTAVRDTAAILSDYVLLSGALICLLAYYRTQRKPILLLFNSLSWLGLLAVSLYQETGAIVWLPFSQVSLGAISSILSFLVLKDIYADVREQQLKQQTFLQPKAPKTMNNFSPNHAPYGTSTPRSTPPDSRFSYVDSTNHSAKISPTDRDREIPSQVGKWPEKYVGLEPGIRGLHLGPVASRPRDDDVHSLWSANTLAGSTTYNPNTSYWSSYSGTPNMTTRSAPVGLPMGFGSLTHVYSANYSNCGDQSRPTSPAQTVMPHSGTSFHGTVDSTTRRRNIMSNTIVSPPRLVLGASSTSGIGLLPDSDSMTRSTTLAPRPSTRTPSDSHHRTSSSDPPGTTPGICSCSFQHLCNSSSCHPPCSLPPLTTPSVMSELSRGHDRGT